MTALHNFDLRLLSLKATVSVEINTGQSQWLVIDRISTDRHSPPNDCSKLWKLFGKN